MALFGKRAYDRADSMARATKAVGRGKRKQAIAEYRRVLKQEPGNPVILAKLAPLLAETRQLKEAGEKWNAAGKQYENQGFPEKALAVYTQAVAYLPRSLELWETISGLYLARSRRADAISALLEGRRHFRRRCGSSRGTWMRRSISRGCSRSPGAAPRPTGSTRVCASTSAGCSCAACAGRCSAAPRLRRRSGAGCALRFSEAE